MKTLITEIHKKTNVPPKDIEKIIRALNTIITKRYRCHGGITLNSLLRAMGY